MSPSILKALSADAEVAGKEELASQYLARRGKSLLCCLHQSMGQSLVFTDPTWCFSLSHSARNLSIKRGAGGCSTKWAGRCRAAKSSALIKSIIIKRFIQANDFIGLAYAGAIFLKSCNWKIFYIVFVKYWLNCRCGGCRLAVLLSLSSSPLL